ncbi:MAG: Eco57I restriction-modification methylase domain-containing protein, partial [Chloroflexota bacterium]
ERGSYYTPKPVVAFIVRRALEGYLERSLPDEDPAASRRLVWGLDPGGLRAPLAALEAVARVKLCDPACGCGAFLMGAMQLLLGLRRCLSTAAETDPFSPHRARMEILRDNLYGVDLDPGAVEIARLRLWLSSMAEQHRAGSCAPPPGPGVDDVSPFGANVRVGDSLAGIDWPATFPEPFAEGGFDVVVMNPPYLLSSRVPGHDQQRFREYANRLRSRYGFVDDLYVHFLHLGLGLLREGGTLCGITSSSFLTNSRKEPLRRELLRHTLRLLVPLGPQLFPAVVYSAITVVERGRPPRPGRPVLYANLRREGAAALADPERVERLALAVSGEEYERAFGSVFFEPTPAHRYLFGTLLADEPAEVRQSGVERGLVPRRPGAGETPALPAVAGAPVRPDGGRRFVRLGEVAPALDTGIHSGNVRHRLFYLDPAPGKELHRMLQGTQLLRYGVWWENPEARYRYVDVGYRPDPETKGVGRGGRPSGRGEYWHFCGSVENHHVAERLLMRQTGDDPFVGYLFQGQEQIYTDNTLHTLLLTDLGRQLGLSYRYLLALLNSGTLRWIYRALAQEEGRMLAQVKTAVVNRLPIAIPTEEECSQLEELAARIQALQEERGLPLTADAAREAAVIQNEMDEAVAELYGLPRLNSVEHTDLSAAPHRFR